MDHRTLFICLVVVLAVNTCAFLLLYLSERRLPSAGWIASAFACFTLGVGLGAARDYLSDFLSIVGGNALTLLGYVLVHRAVTEFVGLGARDRAQGIALVSFVVVASTWFTYVDPSLAARIILMGLAIAAQTSLTSVRLVSATRKTEVGDAARFLAGVLAAVAVLHAWRVTDALGQAQLTNMMNGSAAEALVLLALLVTTSGVAFGFIWMSGSRMHFMLHQQAHRDVLTGLLNRRGFLDVAPAQLLEPLATGQRQLLLYAHLDGLKQINDTAGHDAGDKTIVAVAHILREELRASDSLSRLGGDEFCALLRVNSASDGDAILSRLERRIQLFSESGDRGFVVGLSAATTDVTGMQLLALEDLLKEADKRMYEAKRNRSAADPVGGLAAAGG
jgi:diguanylate cyclase (GGDEF)-like protein